MAKELLNFEMKNGDTIFIDSSQIAAVHKEFDPFKGKHYVRMILSNGHDVYLNESLKNVVAAWEMAEF